MKENAKKDIIEKLKWIRWIIINKTHTNHPWMQDFILLKILKHFCIKKKDGQLSTAY